MSLSHIELRKNRIDHCSKVRGTKDYCEYSVFDKNGIKYLCSCGAIAVDRDGPTPA